VNFDWYGASVDAGPDETLAEVLGAFEMASLAPLRPTSGFNRAMAVKRGDTTLATVMWENLGDPDGNSCFVQGTGRHAAPVATMLRAWMPSHRVARADVAEDYTGEGTWDRLSTLCFNVADDHHVKTEHAGDWHTGVAGRSVYLGGRQSVAREICYEKGKQIGGDPNHVRMELRVRPATRDAKYRASQASPIDLYGAARWSRDLATRLGHPDVAKLSLGTVYRDEDVQRARRSLFRQYGEVLRGIEAEVGSWAAAGVYIGDVLSKS
jgi:hypothetical protein